MEDRAKNLIKFLLLPLLVIFLILVFFTHRSGPDFLLHLNFLNVGQGDSAFIQTPLGRQVLIDGGPSDKVLSLLGKNMPFYDRTIDLVIISHPHADHINGLIDVLKRYKVMLVVMADVAYDSSSFSTLKGLIDKKNIPIVIARANKRIYLDGVTVFDIFWPQNKEGEKSFSEGFGQAGQTLNDTSIVGRVQYVKSKVLFVGDAGSVVENQILPKYNLKSDILKVGHHGSKYSSSENFLHEVSPDYAIISVGKNSYGHPTQEVLDRLTRFNIQIFRTDLSDTVKFQSDGMTLKRK